MGAVYKTIKLNTGYFCCPNFVKPYKHADTLCARIDLDSYHSFQCSNKSQIFSFNFIVTLCTSTSLKK